MFTNSFIRLSGSFREIRYYWNYYMLDKIMQIMGKISPGGINVSSAADTLSGNLMRYYEDPL